MTVAFVASALPARFIRAQTEELMITRIVCASRQLVEVFQYAIPSNISIELLSVPRFGGTLSSLWFLFREVRRAKDIVIFHECCWVALDAIILLIQPRVTFFPHVSLAGFSQPPSSCAHDLSWLIRHFGVVQSLLLLSRRSYFEFYDMPSDGGSGREAVAALRYGRLRDIKLHTYDETARIIAALSPRSNSRGRVALIVCAREPVPDSTQFDLYREACDRLVECGYTIYLKDHPRKAARLNLSYSDAQVIPPHIPADLCDLGASVVVGICSSALAYYGEKAISLVRLLPMSEADVQSRTAHLLFLPKGDEIKFVRNWAEYDNTIALNPCSLNIDPTI